VGMLYSEGYYDPEHSMPYVLECAIEKNRNGERGECLWYFSGEFSRVATLQDGAREQYRRTRAAQRKPQGDDL
jgi:replicative DNA helicase